jgi:integrase
MSVKLRKRKKGDKISLYLDFYNQGKRSYEYLNLYLMPEPEKGTLSRADKEENRRILSLAESIRSKRHLEIQNGIYGFYDQTKIKSSFITYFEFQAAKRKDGSGHLNGWDCSLSHFKKFVKTDVTFAQINKRYLEEFKDYLLRDARTPGKKHLATNSAYNYFNKVRAALKEAYKDGIIPRNPAEDVPCVKQNDPQREYLTYEELQAAAKTECEIPVVKRAFLFSALTGLRWSDVYKMTWQEVQHSEENGYYVRFTQQKTQASETQPISEQAFNLMGERSENPYDRVFIGLRYSCWTNLRIQQWMLKAGVSKTITFHCARHTYATLQLTLGTDIYTVSKLLGHKDLKTTQIYAKVIDERKKEAASRIKLDL